MGCLTLTLTLTLTLALALALALTLRKPITSSALEVHGRPSRTHKHIHAHMHTHTTLHTHTQVRHRALDMGFYPVMLFFSAYLVFLAVITRPAVRVWIHARITLQCEWLFRQSRSFRRVESLTALSSAEADILGRPAMESASRSAVEPTSRPIADGSAARVALQGECVVCCDQLATHLFTACGHLCACSECAKSIIESTALCPICRTPSSTAVKVYVAGMQN